MEFAEKVLEPLVSQIIFTEGGLHSELLNKERREEMSWIVEANGRRAAIRLLREMPDTRALMTDWVGWAKRLAKDSDTALLLVVTGPQLYDAEMVRKALMLLLSSEGRSYVLSSALGLDCFWLASEGRIITVSYHRAESPSPARTR